MSNAQPAYDSEVFRWVAPPPLHRHPLPIKKPFIAEIKPHTKSGIAAGVRQLRGRAVPPDHQRWLVAYRVLAEPKSGTPGRIRVFAYRVAPDGGRQGPWDLGEGIIPVKIGFPRINQPAFFGMAVEPIVGAVFRRWWPPGVTRVGGTGGVRPGPDVMGTELAYFYAELANETADPRFEQLAARHAGLAS